eukprot:scaffold9287_cov126-Isochrysis_galbana.AAC.3
MPPPRERLASKLAARLYKLQASTCPAPRHGRYGRLAKGARRCSLSIARPRPRRRPPSARVEDRRGAHAPLQQPAPELMQPAKRCNRLGRRFPRAPELLGDGGEPRPHSLLHVGSVDRLAPHLAVPAQH